MKNMLLARLQNSWKSACFLLGLTFTVAVIGIVYKVIATSIFKLVMEVGNILFYFIFCLTACAQIYC